MSSPQQRNDRKSRFSGGKNRGPKGRDFGAAPGGAEWIWGRHAVLAALGNPARAPYQRLLATAEALKFLQSDSDGRKRLAASELIPQVMEANEIDRALGRAGASHQGLALAAAAMESADLDDIAVPAEGVIVMLDQVTDPQNVGAILRSAAAFGARGVIVQDRHAPPLAGALAKAAAGALEQTPVLRAVNLARTLDQLADMGWRAVGLAGEGDTALDAAFDGGPTVLVMGSEGEGLRRLVAEHCEVLARIPMPGGFESLNVSNAAAIALYESVRVTNSRLSGERD